MIGEEKVPNCRVRLSLMVPLENARAQLICRHQETVAHPRAYPLITDLPETVGQQVLSLLVARLGVHQVVVDFLGVPVFTLIVEFLTLGEVFGGATHHLYAWVLSATFAAHKGPVCLRVSAVLEPEFSLIITR